MTRQSLLIINMENKRTEACFSESQLRGEDKTACGRRVDVNDKQLSRSQSDVRTAYARLKWNRREEEIKGYSLYFV